MTGLIVIGIIAYVIYNSVSAHRAKARETARQCEIMRIQTEQKRQREEQRRIQEEQKAQRDAELNRIKAVAALERRQELQAKEQARQAKEQERQAAQLAKHEEQINKLAQRIALAERTINHYSSALEEMMQRIEEMENKVWWYEKNGLPCENLKTRLEKEREKAFGIETKLIKARFDKENAEQRLEAA